jgi:hypothetical protein
MLCDFKNIFAEKFGVFLLKVCTACFSKNLILVFEKTPIYRRKLAKMAENCHHM